MSTSAAQKVQFQLYFPDLSALDHIIRQMEALKWFSNIGCFQVQKEQVILWVTESEQFAAAQYCLVSNQNQHMWQKMMHVLHEPCFHQIPLDIMVQTLKQLKKQRVIPVLYSTKNNELFATYVTVETFNSISPIASGIRVKSSIVSHKDQAIVSPHSSHHRELMSIPPIFKFPDKSFSDRTYTNWSIEIFQQVHKGQYATIQFPARELSRMITDMCKVEGCGGRTTTFQLQHHDTHFEFQFSCSNRDLMIMQNVLHIRKDSTLFPLFYFPYHHHQVTIQTTFFLNYLHQCSKLIDCQGDRPIKMHMGQHGLLLEFQIQDHHHSSLVHIFSVGDVDVDSFV